LYSPQDGTIGAEKIATLPGDYRLFYANVRDALLGKSPIDITHEQMLDVMRALELAVESSRTGRTLSWSRAEPAA
jgi:predicted dehydrogenase